MNEHCLNKHAIAEVKEAMGERTQQESLRRSVKHSRGQEGEGCSES